MSMYRAAETNLRWLLALGGLDRYLADPALTDLHINGVGEGMCFVDRGRGMEQATLPYTFAELEMIAINAAALTRQDIAEDVPLVSTALPGDLRCEIARPPATPNGCIAFSIRQPKAETPTPEGLERGGVFSGTVASGALCRAERRKLEALHHGREWRRFLELAIASSLNVVFCGKVGTGKTHVMRAFTHAIPPAWRIVTIEDTHELINLPCRNVVHLLYSKGKQSVATHGAKELVEAALRMGMDGIIAQELRDSSASAYVSVLKSGHWGMTTTHADSPEDVYGRIAGLIKEGEAGRHQREEDILATLHRSIDVVVYCVRDGARRRIESILYDPSLKERYPTNGNSLPVQAAAE